MKTTVKDEIENALKFLMGERRLSKWTARGRVITHFTKMGFGEEFVSVCIESTDIWWEA